MALVSIFGFSRLSGLNNNYRRVSRNLLWFVIRALLCDMLFVICCLAHTCCVVYGIS